MSKEAVAAIDWRQIEELHDLPRERLDELPIGAIQLDREGVVLRYNRTEGELSGRDPEGVIGRRFFEDIAPCTNVREFAGRFRQGFEDKSLNAIFPYRFDFEMAPVDVWVRLF